MAKGIDRDGAVERHQIEVALRDDISGRRQFDEDQLIDIGDDIDIAGAVERGNGKARHDRLRVLALADRRGLDRIVVVDTDLAIIDHRVDAAPGAAVDRIAARARDDHIAAVAAINDIVPRAAIDGVVARPGLDRVVAAAAMHLVMAVKAPDHVIAGCGGGGGQITDEIVARRSDNGARGRCRSVVLSAT